jgi:cytochrome c553
MSQRNRGMLLGSVCLVAVTWLGQTQAQIGEPVWAYAFSAPPKPGDTYVPQTPAVRGVLPGEDAEEIMQPRHVEGSSASYSRMEVRDNHNVIDWFPGDHPTMPDVVEHGPKALEAERGRGCGSCHLPNGKGRPENAPLAGQPAAYLIRQLQDMRKGLRSSADPRKRNTPTMIELAKAMTEEEIQAAAEYFAAIPYTTWMHVIEADVIPAQNLQQGDMFITQGEEPTEPLAGRIVETPVDEFQANYVRNPRSPWIVYVPVGSLARGKELVTTGGGKTVSCTICHGADLQGLADVPGIAGRSPSYMMRQLYDMKAGTRNGLSAQLMKPVIANLDTHDLTDIIAYLTSIEPPTPMPTNVQ